MNNKQIRTSAKVTGIMVYMVFCASLIITIAKQNVTITKQKHTIHTLKNHRFVIIPETDSAITEDFGKKYEIHNRNSTSPLKKYRF